MNLLNIFNNFSKKIVTTTSNSIAGIWTKLGVDIDGEAIYDQSGYSVSINAAGDKVAIGAIGNDGSGTSAGHTRIYQWNGSAWTQMGVDINGEAAFDQSGVVVSMNAAGDRVAIGAVYNDGNGAESGHTRIYQWNSSAWIQLGSDINGEATNDYSGWSVSMNAAGDRVAIGAPYNDGNGVDSGHVRIYYLSGGSAWVQLGTDINGEATSDLSGYSVSMNAAGDRVVIGAIYNSGNGTSSGQARIYQWNSSAWIQLGSDINGEASPDLSGWSVSMNAAGDRVAIGARDNAGNGTGSGSGHVRIYQWSASVWTQMGSDIDAEAGGDQAGRSVSINAAGDRVVIGAAYNDGNGVNSGQARIYQWNGSAWTKLGADIDGEAAGDQSGWSVSINAAGDRVAIGARLNNTETGQVRIYSLNLTQV